MALHFQLYHFEWNTNRLVSFHSDLDIIPSLSIHFRGKSWTFHKARFSLGWNFFQRFLDLGEHTGSYYLPYTREKCTRNLRKVGGTTLPPSQWFLVYSLTVMSFLVIPTWSACGRQIMKNIILYHLMYDIRFHEKAKSPQCSLWAYCFQHFL